MLLKFEKSTDEMYAYEWDEYYKDGPLQLGLWYDNNGESVGATLTTEKGQYVLKIHFAKCLPDEALPNIIKITGICNGYNVTLKPVGDDFELTYDKK